MKAQLPSWKSLTEYATVARWIWLDSVWRFRSDMSGILVAGVTGLACQFAAFNVLLFYARALEADKTLHFLGNTISARSSTALLVGAAVLAFLFLSTYALLLYRSNTRSVWLRRRYEEFCEKRILVLASRLPHPDAPHANHMLTTNLLKDMGRRWPRSCGMVLRLLLNGILPATRTAGCIVILLFINAFFSSILFVLLAVSGVFIYGVNSATAKTARLAEQHRESAARERRRLHERSCRAPAAIRYGDRATETVFSEGETSRLFDAFFRRYELAEGAGLVINLLTAVSLLVVVLVAGTGALSGDQNWSVFLAYLVALRFFLTSLMQLGRMFTDSSRFYPQVQGYHQFVTDAERASSNIPQLAAEGPISLDVADLEHGRGALELRSGRPTFLIHSGRIDRRLVNVLARSTRPRGATVDGAAGLYWFAGDSASAGSTLREFYDLPHELGDSQIWQELRELGAQDVYAEGSEPSVDDVLTDEGPAGLLPGLLRLFGILAAIHSRRPVLVLSEADLSLVETGEAERWPRTLSERILIVACPQPPANDFASDDTAVVISNGDELAGWCTLAWVRDHPELLERDEGTKKSTGTGGAAPDDDLLDDPADGL